MLNFQLICSVVNSGIGSKVLKKAKQHGAKGGTIFLGNGTVKNNKLLEFLDLTDIRKEIVIMIVEKEPAAGILKALNTEMDFRKPNHGIAFSFSLSNYIGTKHCEYYKSNDDKAVSQSVYNAIFTVVEKGRAEEVVDAATKAGAKGGTIINARGSGINDTGTLFTMPIEPEKEIVLILAENAITEAITAAIRTDLEIDEPGNGIIFIVGLDETYGLY